MHQPGPVRLGVFAQRPRQRFVDLGEFGGVDEPGWASMSVELDGEPSRACRQRGCHRVAGGDRAGIVDAAQPQHAPRPARTDRGVVGDDSAVGGGVVVVGITRPAATDTVDVDACQGDIELVQRTRDDLDREQHC